MKNIWIRIVTSLTTLYEILTFVAPFIYFFLIANTDLNVFIVTLCFFAFYIPMSIHYGAFGEKAKKTIDRIMMW